MRINFSLLPYKIMGIPMFFHFHLKSIFLFFVYHELLMSFQMICNYYYKCRRSKEIIGGVFSNGEKVEAIKHA